MPGRKDLQLRHGRARDRSIVLVLCGAIALLPPVVSISMLDATLFGIPVPVLYVFSVWALLIAGALGISRALTDGTPAPGKTREPDRS